MQHRHEQSDGTGAKRGSYGYVDANGIYRKVEYIADEHGFRVKMSSNEPGVKDVNSPSVSMVTQPIPNSYTEAPVIVPSEHSSHVREPKIAYHDSGRTFPSTVIPPTEETIVYPPPKIHSEYHEPQRRPVKKYRPKLYAKSIKAPSTEYAIPFKPSQRLPPSSGLHVYRGDSTEKQLNSIPYHNKYESKKYSHDEDERPYHYLEKPTPLQAPYEIDRKIRPPLPPPPPSPSPSPPSTYTYPHPPSSLPAKSQSYTHPSDATYHRSTPLKAYGSLLTDSQFDPQRNKGEPVMPIVPRKRPSAYPPHSIGRPQPPQTHYSIEHGMRPKVYYENPDHFAKSLSLIKPADQERYHIHHHDSGPQIDEEPVYINKLPDDIDDKRRPSLVDYHSYGGPAGYITNKPYQADGSNRHRSHRAYTEFKSGLRGLFPMINRSKQDPYSSGSLADDASEKVNFILKDPSGMQNIQSTPKFLDELELPTATIQTTLANENFKKITGAPQAPLYRD
ncbi:uncharacterized protein LOC141855898 isoform X2 [Brevipalpus obovatus]